ncbi:methionyl-tRNA formyltransferase [Mycoplasmatota bacterium WC30]
MKICFMGSMKFAVPILEGLNKKYEIVMVVTQPDKPVGRKGILTGTAVKIRALELGLPIFQPVNIKNDYKPIMDLNLDYIIVAAYGQMIPEIVLSHPKTRAINVHASLLPKYRGGSPMHRAIQYGDSETGITVMYMAMKMDAGDILSQKSIPILKSDNVGTLEAKLGIVGNELLLDTLENINQIVPRKQDINLVTFARNIKPEEERIYFQQNAESINNHVRGFYPWPLTYCIIDKLKLKLYNITFVDEDLSSKPGEIVKIDKQGVYVQTTKGLIILKDVQLQGKKRMKINDFMNGAGKTLLKLGDRFE